MRTFITTIIAIASLSLLSFKGDNNISAVGVYGVCESDPSSITLTLNDDNTFEYQDLSIANAPIHESGTWKQHGRVVELQANDANSNFHHKWKIDGNSAKSRKGMCFYTLRRLN
ncbi:MAG: hypothetical protein R2809_08130 [Flavobacteriales bacterium]